MMTRAVDLAHLARYTGGEAALDAEILRLFQTQSGDLLSKIQAALDAGDSKNWRELLHSFKGAARGIGAFALGDAVAEAEHFDPGENRSKAQAALATLKSRAGLVSHFIDNYLA